MEQPEATVKLSLTVQATEKTYTRAQTKVATAIACCGAVAKMVKHHGGPFVALPVPARVAMEPVKAKRGGYHLKRTLKGMQ